MTEQLSMHACSESKNRMVVWVQNGCKGKSHSPCDHGADWVLSHPASLQRIRLHVACWGKDQSSKYGFY